MRPIGSEKIKDNDQKLARLLEIAGISKGSIKESVTPTYGRPSDVLHEATASDGTEYAIVQEQKNVYIKVKKNNLYEYMTGVQNIHEHSYKTYSDALKHLNIMFKEINENVGHKGNIDILKKKV
jgi:hypothetical protein